METQKPERKVWSTATLQHALVKEKLFYFKIAQGFNISLLVESFCDQHGKKSSGEELS